MSKVRRNSILVLILTIGILVYILHGNFTETIKYASQTNILLLIIAMLLFVISWIFDSLSYYFIIKQFKDDYKIKQALRLNILTKFFNGITPLASGGQPLQLYTLHKDKVKMHDATTIVIQFFIIYQIALIALSGGCILFTIITKTFFIGKLLKSLLLVGFLANFSILLVLLIISFNKKINKLFINGIINILSNLRLVKNKQKTKEKWNDYCDNFYASAKIMFKNKGIFVLGILLQLLQLIFQYAIPFVLVKAIGCENTLTLVQAIISSSYVFLIGCFVPIPGATGGMEAAFAKCFGNFIIDESIHTIIILWRLITYIIPVIAGGIIFNIKTKDQDIDKELKA